MNQELRDAIADMVKKKAAFYKSLAKVKKLGGLEMDVIFLELLLKKDCELTLR
jgi:hypothetical protein